MSLGGLNSNMRIERTKLLLILAVILSLLLFFVVVLFFWPSRPDQSASNPTPTPVGLDEDGHQDHPGHDEVGPFPSPNPTFTELLKTQPFWDMLPHRTDVYLIEHIMHNNTIRITTLGPSGENRDALIESYRNQALGWLTANGANLSELQIEYVPEI